MKQMHVSYVGDIIELRRIISSCIWNNNFTVLPVGYTIRKSELQNKKY